MNTIVAFGLNNKKYTIFGSFEIIRLFTHQYCFEQSSFFCLLTYEKKVILTSEKREPDVRENTMNQFLIDHTHKYIHIKIQNVYGSRGLLKNSSIESSWNPGCFHFT